jgi:hypothetical protein
MPPLHDQPGQVALQTGHFTVPVVLGSCSRSGSGTTLLRESNSWNAGGSSVRPGEQWSTRSFSSIASAVSSQVAHRLLAKTSDARAFHAEASRFPERGGASWKLAHVGTRFDGTLLDSTRSGN